jgi:rRNA processing protein Krr1/Pno1
MLAKGSMHKSVYAMLQGVKSKDKLERMRLWEDNVEKDATTPSES